MSFLLKILAISLALLAPVSAGQWRSAASVPAILPSAQAIEINGQIYVLSGTVGYGLRQFFEVYDPKDDGWRPLMPLPSDIDQFAVGRIGDRIIVTGGRDRQSSQPVATAWLYVPNSALWVEIPPLPMAVYGHNVVRHKGAIYLLGGEGKRYFWRLDGALQAWEMLAELPASGSGAAAIADDQFIYFISGEQAWRWSANRWERLADMPRALRNASLQIMDDGVHLIGGFDPSINAASQHHFVFNDGAWRKAADLPQGRHLMGSAVVNNELYIIGGASGSGFFSFFTGSDRLFVYQEK